MSGPLDRFERIVRSVAADQPAPATPAPADVEPVEEVAPEELHPFETRNIHPDIPKRVRKLYDDGYLAESVFAAFKFIEKEVKRIGGVTGTGIPLMMNAFNEDNPKIQLNALQTESEVDEQRGYKFIFAGGAAGIRNPRGHDDIVDTPDEALDYLALASLLIRRLDAAGLRT